MLGVLDQARPSVILLMDPTVDFAQEVRRRFPKAFIIGRIYVVDQPLDNPTQRGSDFADRVSGLAVPLKGTVDTKGNFSFTVQQSAGQTPLVFYGTVQQGVYLVGHFCSSSTNSCSASTGYFTAGPKQ